MNNNIPKVIHYCWFGGNPLPELAQKCISSWKKYCPDYEIIRWDESNFDISICDYVRDAFKEKKWAFVSDYARFWILYNYGGLYFDTDVEIIKPLDDIVANGPFMGREPILSELFAKSKINVAPGLGLGAYPHMDLYKKFIDFYEQKSFYTNDKEIDNTTVVEYITKIIDANRLIEDDIIQKIDDISIYPPEYFCPMNYSTGVLSISEKTVSIHHYTESWKSIIEKKQNRVLRKCVCVFGERLGYRVWRCYTFPFRIKEKIRKKGLKGTIKFVVSKVRR